MNITSAKHIDIFPTCSSTQNMSHQFQEATCMCFCFWTEVLQGYAVFRSLGPKERGSSSSTVIASYVPSGFVMYAIHCVPNCTGKNRKLWFYLFIVCGPVIPPKSDDYFSSGSLKRQATSYSEIIKQLSLNTKNIQYH